MSSNMGNTNIAAERVRDGDGEWSDVLRRAAYLVCRFGESRRWPNPFFLWRFWRSLAFPPSLLQSHR